VPKELREQIEQFLEASVLDSDKLKFLGWKGSKAAMQGLKKGQKAVKNGANSG
jgi:hypothetical protein